MLKIKIRNGGWEFEYEGEEDSLESVLKTVSSIMGEQVTRAETETQRELQVTTSPSNNFSSNTIAACIKADKGPDVLIAAAASLTLAQNKDRFTRRELLDEMQKATSFYKSSYSSNLSSYINGFVRSGRLLSVAKDTYVLSSKEKQSVQDKLSDL